MGMSDVRPPAVAGGFYRSDPAGLERQIEACFRDDHGPGEPPDTDDRTGASGRGSPETRADERSLLGLVVPHAGFRYSGPIAAHGYAALAESNPPETAVILGPNHRRIGATLALAPHDAWRTPLGTVPIDDELRSAIREADRQNGDGAIRDDFRAHETEHSIEVQLPFLQFLGDPPRIVPVAVASRDPARCRSLGEAVADAIERTGRDAVVIASTDLTHYEPPEAAAAADEPVLDRIADLDADGLLTHVGRTAHTMCGPGATAATLTAVAGLGADEGSIYAYATSADTADTGARTVGYPAIGLERS